MRAKQRHRDASSQREKRDCRSASRNVPWNFLRANATMAAMEKPRANDETLRVQRPNERPVSHADIPHATHGMYLGKGRNGWTWAGPQRSVLVLGPSRSGKTTSLVIPNLLSNSGPVVSTSTKSDVMDATAPYRCGQGWAFLYDPSGEIACPPGVERVGWSPLTTASDWDCAVQTSDAMVGASRLSSGSSSHSAADSHWTERASALLAPLLHAAAQEKYPMRTVLRWIDRHNAAEPLEILSSAIGDDATATDLLAGIVATDSREQSGIWSTASGVLAAYRSEAAMASTQAPPLDAAEFCRGANTMYICSPGRRQHQFAPLVVAAIGDVRDATYRAQRDGERLSPTLFALDEVANIAPIPDLPSMVSEGAGQGLTVLACLQDLSQARVRWGGAADGFLSLFGTTVVMPGIADAATLRDLSALGGDYEVATTTVSHSLGQRGRIRPASSTGTVRLPRYPIDAIAQGHAGDALVVGADKHFGSVTLTPAYACPPWRDRLVPTRQFPRETALPERERDHGRQESRGR
jgi:type IV secretion system protein VirD4